jgi:hypothetical protein
VNYAYTGEGARATVLPHVSDMGAAILKRNAARVNVQYTSIQTQTRLAYIGIKHAARREASTPLRLAGNFLPLL